MNHREFNRETRKLAKRTWPEGFEDAAGDVFLGGMPPEHSEEWVEAHTTAVRLMRVLAGRLTDDKHLYNSAKHGLSCLAVNQSIAFYKDFKDGKPVGEPTIGADGAAMVFLEKEEKSKGEWTWYHKSQWLNAQQAALLTHLAVVQMEALWTVARARYLGKPLEPFEVVDNDAIEHALKGFSTDCGILTWRRAVATERTATSSPDTSSDPPTPDRGKRLTP